MPSAISASPRTLDVAIIGSGLGGLSAAIALRRQGHRVTVYERYDFANEVGASLSVASNGSRFLEQWKVDIPAVKPVILQRLIMHEWESGAIKGEYGLGDYKAKFGTVSDVEYEILSNAGPDCRVGVFQFPPDRYAQRTPGYCQGRFEQRSGPSGQNFCKPQSP